MSWVEQKGVRLTTTEALIAILGYIGFFTVKRQIAGTFTKLSNVKLIYQFVQH